MTIKPNQVAVVRRALTTDVAEFRAVSEAFDPGMIDLPENLFHDRYARLVGRDDYCLLLAMVADRVGDYPRYPGFSLDLRSSA